MEHDPLETTDRVGILPQEVRDRVAAGESLALLDVRTPEEHAVVALAGARLIPLGELPARVGELAEWRDRELVVYCHHGVRSLHAIEFLRRAGFRRLRNLSGGIDRWAVEVEPGMVRYCGGPG